MTERIAFGINGANIRRVPLSDNIRPGMQWYYWSFGPPTEVMTHVRDGRTHLEVSRDVLDGTGDSMRRLAKALGMSPASGVFLMLYSSLLAMVQPRLSDL